MEEIVIATGNPHKVEELRAIFAGEGIPVTGLRDLPEWGSLREPEETGDTFEANARIKALSYAAQTGRLCLADDSGLEVDALGGAPGVVSSHYSTDGRDTGVSREERDAANNARLLRELAGVPPERRTARFVCVMCLARPEQGGTGVPPVPRTRANPGESRPNNQPLSRHRQDACATVLQVTRGTFEGRIGLRGEVPRGSNGFGYDPLFLLPAPDARTSAELTPPEKNARSHRGAAARAMAAGIRRLFPA